MAPVNVLLLLIVNFWLLIVGDNIGADISSDIVQFCHLNSSSVIRYNHTEFQYLNEEPNLCGNRSVFLLFYVQSAVHHVQQRHHIRESLAAFRSIDGARIRLLFVVGRATSLKLQNQLFAEMSRHRDIVQADFVDVYANLTLKHIVALHWIVRHCPQAAFVCKSDDDTFVHVFNLHLLLNNMEPNRAFVLGRISRGETPIRKRGFKWTVSKAIYPENKYPNFIKGIAYVMSRAALEPLLVCSYYRAYLFIDDVFITGLVASMAKITLVPLPTTALGLGSLRSAQDRERVHNFCFLSGSNTLDPATWRKLWQKILLDHSNF